MRADVAAVTAGTETGPVEVTAAVVVAVAAAAFLIGLAKGGLSGLGPLLTLLVATTVPTKLAVGLLLPMLMVGDVAALVVHWNRWDRAKVVRLLPGAALGVVLASLFLQAVSERGMQIALAVFTFGFVAHRLFESRFRPNTSVEPGLAWAGVAGAAAGVTSTVAHVGGPPVAAYLLAAKVPPRPFVATNAALFFLVNWLKVPGYLAADLFDADLLSTLAPVVVLIPPGIVVGRWFVTVVNQELFDRFILGSLILGAVLLVI